MVVVLWSPQGEISFWVFLKFHPREIYWPYNFPVWRPMLKTKHYANLIFEVYFMLLFLLQWTLQNHLSKLFSAFLSLPDFLIFKYDAKPNLWHLLLKFFTSKMRPILVTLLVFARVGGWFWKHIGKPLSTPASSSARCILHYHFSGWSPHKVQLQNCQWFPADNNYLFNPEAAIIFIHK